jgi:hypothetical protein
MKPTSHLAIFLLLSALTFSLAHAQAKGGQGQGKSHGGGQATSRMSNKGSANTNAQWSADPERGWVRAGERQDHATTKQNQGKQKTNDEKQKKK